MSGPSWTDIVGAVGGIIGAGGGVVGVVIAGLAKRDSSRSADASVKSASASEKSADAAVALTTIEQERREDEREQRHDDLAPQIPGEIVTELRDDRATRSLFGSITVPRGYRVRADTLRPGWSAPIGIDSVLHPKRPTDFQIEDWPPGSTQPKTEAIRFRFWPPIEGDGVDVWTCPCGRPTGEAIDGPGHWEWVVRIAEPPVEPWVSQG